MSVGAVNKQTGERIPTAGMPAIDDALDLTSVNPVQNAIVTAALANKQDATDNSLQTTDKTVVGAINEHEGDIGSLKSGLINLDNNFTDAIGWDRNPNMISSLENGAWSFSTGNPDSAGGQYVRSSKIKCNGNTAYVASLGENSLGIVVKGFVYWDNNGNYIGYNVDTYKCTTPANAGYIGVNFSSSNQINVYDVKNAQLEKGTAETPYEPYHPVIGDAVQLNTNDLTTPSRTKNLLPMTLSGIKSANTTGTWSGNSCTVNGVTFTVQTDDNGNVTGITANGTATNSIYFIVGTIKTNAGIAYTLTGCPSGGDNNSYYLGHTGTSNARRDFGSGKNFPIDGTDSTYDINIFVANGYAVNSLLFAPMIRLTSDTSTTFAPYIPSVESRIEAVESGLTKLSELRVYKKWANSITVPAGMNTIVMFAGMSGKSNMFTYNSYSKVLTPIGDSSGITATADTSTETVTFSASTGGSFAVYVL